MNFLAHLYLSGSNQKIMVGNFIGDFVKGSKFENFEEEIKTGILLHRNIDAFTDQHPVVIKSKKKLRKKYRHYSGVIVDMFYDHFLAVHWSIFHPIPLEEYTHKAYQTILQYVSILPEKVTYMLPFMIKNNWLFHYAQKEGVHRALSGMAKRTSFNSGMEQAVHDLTLHYEAFQEEFLIFFPEVKAFADEWISGVSEDEVKL